MRLFAGIALPPEAIEALTHVRLRLASPKDGLRWSTPDQWHVTLRFFGEVSGEQSLGLTQALTAVRAKPLTVVMDALGIFGAKGILYASVVPSEELADLHVDVERCATDTGSLPDTHSFRPHLTVARSKNRTGKQTLERLGRPALPSLGRPVRWTAKEFLLYESVLGASGAAYHVRARYPIS